MTHILLIMLHGNVYYVIAQRVLYVWYRFNQLRVAKEHCAELFQFLLPLCRLLVLALPLVAQNLFIYGSSLISLMFVGHLGTFELSAAVLANSALNITGFAFLVGLASAMETLCGQVCCTLALALPRCLASAVALLSPPKHLAHGVDQPLLMLSPLRLDSGTSVNALPPNFHLCVLQAYGAKHYTLLGLTLQRGLLICTIFFCLGFPFWTHLEPLLLLCGALAAC